MDELFWEIQITLGQGTVLTVPKPPPPKPIVELCGKEVTEIRCPQCGLHPKEYMGKWSCNCRVYESRTVS